MICPGTLRPGSKWPCGQCKNCRINRKRIWTARLLLESTLHVRTYFITLTYSPEHLPQGGNLDPEHLQLWLKRLRFACQPLLLRFFAVGEYGERYLRPHYHALVFAPDIPGFTQIVDTTWGWGRTQTGIANVDGISYIAGYVLKKASHEIDLSHLVPEFARMSRRPGIGGDTAPLLAKVYNTPAMAAEVSYRGDVLSTFRLAGGIWPMGRYMRLRVRTDAGYPAQSPHYRMAALAALPLHTPEQRAAKRKEAIAKASRLYRLRQHKARL